MPEENKPATLAPGDAELEQLVEEVAAECHPRLVGATFRTFFKLGSPVEQWGSIRVATELEWWLDSDGVDVILAVNGASWGRYSPAGRRGLVDFFLSQVRRKEGGKTVMETDRGERVLYERLRGSLGLPLRALVRNPEFVAETPELARLQGAVSLTPEQFEIQFPEPNEPVRRGRRKSAARALGADEAGEPGGSAVYRPDLEPAPAQHFYRKATVTDHGPAALRFTTPDFRLDTLSGVHYFNSAAEAAQSEDLAELEYAADPNILAAVEDALEADREDWAAAAERTDGADDPVA